MVHRFSNRVRGPLTESLDLTLSGPRLPRLRWRITRWTCKHRLRRQRQMVLACRKWRTRNVWWWKCWKWEPWPKRHRLLLSTWALDGGADLVLFAPGRQDLRRSGPLLARHRHRRRQPHRHRRHTLWRLLSYLNTARRCSDSAFAISIPHGAAATARVPSQYRTALQREHWSISCFALVTANIDGRFRFLHWSQLILMVDFAFCTGHS